MDVMRKELAWESDYFREAECATNFRYCVITGTVIIASDALTLGGVNHHY